MKSAAEILAPALRRAMPKRSAFDWMVTAWPAIVGRHLSVCSKPKSLGDGLLLVAVSGKEWRTGMDNAEIAGELRNRVNVAWGGSLVREVTFCDAKPSGGWVPKAADNSYTPFVRKRNVSTGPSTARAGQSGERAGEGAAEAKNGKEPRR
jgi:hypothetical protein